MLHPRHGVVTAFYCRTPPIIWPGSFEQIFSVKPIEIFQFLHQICKIYADLYSEAHTKYSWGRSKIDINQILKDLWNTEKFTFGHSLEWVLKAMYIYTHTQLQCIHTYYPSVLNNWIA